MKDKQEKWWNSPFIIIATIAIIIVYGSYIFNFYNQTISKSSGDWGTFGDFIGGTLNPTLAFLSLLAILQTIRIQSKELAKSSEALELSKKELSRSASAQEKQLESIKIQNFENTFFNLLKFHNSIVNNFKLSRYDYSTAETDTFNKEEAFRIICDDIITKSRTDNSYFTNVSNIYNEYYLLYQNILNKYFDNIYQIFNFISDSNFSHKEKKKYSDIFRVQFSQSELELLFYHCTYSNGFITLKPYIEEFNFFEFLILKESNKNFKFIISNNIYKPNAFGNNYTNIKKIKEAITLDLEKISSKKESLLNPFSYNDSELLDYCFLLFISKKYDEAIETFNKLYKKITNPTYKIDNSYNIQRIENFINQIKKFKSNSQEPQ